MNTPSIDTERRVLVGHAARGTQGPSGCASAFFIAFGVPFMAAGTFMGLVSQGFVQMKMRGSAPDWVLPVMALVFFIPGFLLSVFGVRSVFRGWAYRRRHAEHPQEPWLADGWAPEGIKDQPRMGLVTQLVSTGFITLFLTPFNYFVFVDPSRSQDAPFFAKALVGFFDLIPLLMVFGILTTLWHKVRYGRSRIAFGTFPFYVGQGFNVRLAPGRSIGSFQKLVFTLRCVEERTETRRTSKGHSTTTVCDQLWAAETTLSESWALQEGEIPVAFRLPEGDFGTRLGEAPVRYWELEVSADTPGLDYSAVFPVPVYARPSAGAVVGRAPAES